jgi:GNAT superfamily N-acetyltransferase
MITIKTPDESSRQGWESLFRGYAKYYDMPMTDSTLETVWSWIQSGRLQGRIAVDEGGQALGLMHFRVMISPLRGSEVGFLDDLFVIPAHRGSGVVTVMLSALKEEASAQGWPLVRWITRENNYRARTVYDRAAQQTNWVTYQLNVNL